MSECHEADNLVCAQVASLCAPPVTVAVDDVTLRESDPSALFTVALSGPSPGPVTVAFELEGFVRTFEETLPDVVRIVVEYRDATNSVARKLNLDRGADPFVVFVVEAADAFLEVYPPGSAPRGRPKL